LHHFQNCKTRHPHILKVYATLDTDANPSPLGHSAATRQVRRPVSQAT
jgi:hypothetical protein